MSFGSSASGALAALVASLRGILGSCEYSTSGFRGVIVVTRARTHASLKDLNCAEIIVLEEPGLHHQTHPTSWPLSVTLLFLFGIQLSWM